MKITDYIPVGRKNAVTRRRLRQLTGLSDRMLRLEIQRARRTHIILNLSDGRGYYQPDLEIPSERAEIIDYVRQEESRLKSIGYALKPAREAVRAFNQ